MTVLPTEDDTLLVVQTDTGGELLASAEQPPLLVVDAPADLLLTVLAPDSPTLLVVRDGAEDLSLDSPAPTLLVVDTPPVPMVTVADPIPVPGPQGLPGPRGPAGGESGSYTHNQLAASAVWTITHPLGYVPAVQVIDTSGRVVIGDVTVQNLFTVTITFSAALSGTAYLT